MSVIEITEVLCEYRKRLLGTDIAMPRFSWKLHSAERGIIQHACRLQLTLADDIDFHDPLWDSGKIETEQSIQFAYEGKELRARTAYSFRVKAWSSCGAESEWSEAITVETGLLHPSQWQAKWITPDVNRIHRESEPIFQLRREFELDHDIVSARVYATAAGVYELYINGQQASDDVLAPGWTSYHHRLQYQTYDVTALLRNGGNAIGIWLGDGWYRGKLGFNDAHFVYGDHRAALLELHVRYRDGREQVVISDSSWKASTGPVLYSNLYHGEVYDASLEQHGWNEHGFDDSHWSPVQTLRLPYEPLLAQENWATVVTQKIQPVKTGITPAGAHILDMGQNMVGRLRLSVRGADKGSEITLRFAEVLDAEGNIYFGNLRTAKQTVTYRASGDEHEQYAPHFTFQGFRYVQVEGYPGQEQHGLSLADFSGEVLHSDMPSTGEFACSDDRINQLQQNIRWGQRGNFLDVPTDCPQRDERLGWTGDAQVFISTALFNYGGGPFFTKWLHDVQAEQQPDGGIPFVVPNIIEGSSSAAWGDAAVICPWTMYQYYGDTRLLAEQYDSMKRWVDYIRAQGEDEYLWNTGFHFGDWLGLDAKEGDYVGATPTDLIATAYYAYSCRLVAQAADVLNLLDDAAYYHLLHEQVVRAFREEFVTLRGRIAAPTQTAHVLALVFDLVEPAIRARVAADLNRLVVDNDYHLTTGFVGTPYLCFALSDHGYHETAMRLLTQQSYPGWLYSVSQGATTIWEHWDSIKPDGSFWSDDMNSFNHYSYGAVGDWMYRRIAGLDMREDTPAYRRIRLHPQFGGRQLTYARAAHESLYGTIECGWTLDHGQLFVNVRIPANTTASLTLRGAAAEQLLESGQNVHVVAGILRVEKEADGVRLKIGSGVYRFSYPAGGLFRRTYTEQTMLSELQMDQQAVDVLNRHAPQLLNGALTNIVHQSSLRQIADNKITRVSEETLGRIVNELQHL
ncbi:family 78 glycoside hydrolase catalytic domain [Paenibacillus sp. WLX1005]|uniref:family 78 glycoside hydrolase catalytic domain n=1 Tax=Paenibacillus sp. WLX1005 TaxID=3243766 RepID=UPI0039841FE7